MILIKTLLISLLLLSLSHNCFAVTEFVSTINTAATEDYNTLTLWEAAMDNAGNLTDGTVKCGSWDNQSGVDIADAVAVTWDAGVSTGTLIHMTNANGYGTNQYLIDVTAGTLDDNDTVSDGTNTFQLNGEDDSCIITAHLYNDDGNLDDKLTVDGFTASETNYVKITSPVGERHTGVLNTGAKIDTSSAGTMIDLLDVSIRLSYIEMNGDSTNSTNNEIIDVNATNTRVENMLIQGDEGENRGYLVDGGFIGRISNTLFYRVGGTNRSAVEAAGGATLHAYNITVFDGTGVGYSDITATSNLQNCSCFATTSNCFNGLETNEVDYSISYDGTADDFGGIENQVNKKDTTSYFVNLTTDFHIKNNASVLISAGTDLSGDANYPISNDFDNQTRSGKWDVGADQFPFGNVSFIEKSSFQETIIN